MQRTDFAEPVTFEFDFENQNNENNRCISIAEPMFVDPDSYNNITFIMDKLKEAFLFENNWLWSFVGCDGIPYIFANGLTDSDSIKCQWVGIRSPLRESNKDIFNVYPFRGTCKRCAAFSNAKHIESVLQIQ